MPFAPRGRRTRRLLVALAAAALPLTVLALPSTAQAVGPAGGSGDGSQTVYVATKQCDDPAPGHATCFAQRLVAKRVPSGGAAARSTPVRSAAGRGPAGGFTPGQVARAYGVDNTAPATEQVVALVGAYHSPDVVARLNAFDAHYKLPKEKFSTLRVINGDGTATLPTGTNAGWAGEADLDVQAVRGMCHTCKILLVESKSSGVGRLSQASATGAAYSWVKGDGSRLKVAMVSNSFGGPEGPDGLAADQAAYDHPGTVILASAGDAGWFDWDYVLTNHPDYVGNATNVPASYPTVIGVGGTTLKVDATTGARTTEAVWNRDGNEGISNTLGATGSGCSEVYDAQAWQSAAAGYDTLGCASGRASEIDVAALADPYTGLDIYTSGGWATFGGTSLSSPLVAAMWALAGGPQGTAYPEQTLYQHFAAGTGLYDVTLGGNGLCGRDSASTCASIIGGDPNDDGHGPLDCKFAWPGHPAGTAAAQCNARAGLDGPSGVGTPAGLTAFAPLTDQ